MSDIQLINILNAPQQVKQSGLTDSNSTNLPPVIQRVPPGSTLAGFIINRDVGGNPILRTENGDITFQSKLFLKIGTEVTIKVDNKAGATTARILTINGQPPPQTQQVSVLTPGAYNTTTQQTSAPAQQAPTTQAATTGTANTAAPAPAATVSSNPTLTGSVISSPAGNPLPAGTPLAVKVITVTPPQGGAQPAAQTAAPAPVAAAPPPAQAPVNPTDAAHYAAYKTTGAASTPPPNTAPAIPGTPVAPTATPTTGNTPAIQTGANITVQATVTGSTPAGETIVQTQQGFSIRIATPNALPQGSNVTLQASPSALPQPTSTLPAIASLTQKWPSLSSLIHVLSQELSTDQLAQTNIAWLSGISQGSSQPPPTPQQISNGLILFVLGLKSGDFKNWLGKENVQLLESKGQQALLTRAEGDFSALARQFSETPSGQWQSIFFPLAVHGELQQLRFFLKRDRKSDKDEAKEDEDTRFVIETELSQLGELQLDGFTRKYTDRLEFDLYIRTRSPLDEETQKGIFSIYNNFGELTGYKGQLAFQTVEEFPVHPLEEIIQEDDVGDVIV